MFIVQIMYIIGCIASTLCIIPLVTTWCLIPRWRTLQNYISLNQIVTGSLHLIGVTISDFIFVGSIDLVIPISVLTGFLFGITLCWSLSNSVLAYLRLVLIYPRKISCEKRQITVITYLIVILVKLISDVIIPEVFELDVYRDEILILIVKMYTSFILMTLILIIFVRIVMSVMACCRRSMSKRKINHVLSLVGVALICDSALIAHFIFMVLGFYTSFYYIALFSLTHRLVFQSMFVLLKRSSRMDWKYYLKRRQNLGFNNIRLT